MKKEHHKKEHHKKEHHKGARHKVEKTIHHHEHHHEHHHKHHDHMSGKGGVEMYGSKTGKSVLATKKKGSPIKGL